MSQEAKNMIRKCAWEFFPAQELWINKENEFWAYEKSDYEIYITNGKYTNTSITYSTETYPSDNVDDLVDFLTKEKSQQGFECFAIELLS